MTDKFESHAANLTSPASAGAIVTPSDSNDLPVVSRAVYVGTGGSLRVQLNDQAPGASVTLQNVQPGMLYPLRVRRIMASGTTAGGIISVW